MKKFVNNAANGPNKKNMGNHTTANVAAANHQKDANTKDTGQAVYNT